MVTSINHRGPAPTTSCTAYIPSSETGITSSKEYLPSNAHTNQLYRWTFSKSRSYMRISPLGLAISRKRKLFEILNDNGAKFRCLGSAIFTAVEGGSDSCCYDWFSWLGSHKCSLSACKGISASTWYQDILESPFIIKTWFETTQIVHLTARQEERCRGSKRSFESW